MSFTSSRMGIWMDPNGYLVLVGPDGNGRVLNSEAFSNFFLGNRNPSLVVLNACHTAETSTYSAHMGLAPQLVRRGIQAVIAMRYAMADTTARLFAGEFYHALALGWPIEAAMQTTRNAISMGKWV